jgi:hypothetical protein
MPLLASRLLAAAVLITAAALATAADDPPPLVKPVVPAAASARVRFPITETAEKFCQFKAQITNPKKKGEMLRVKVLLDTLPNVATVGLKTWQDWGFEVPGNRVGVIPELIISASQIAPKAAKGGDVEFRLKDVKVNIYEPPASQPAVIGECDLWLSLRDLTGGADKTYEPRLHFADKFVELTAPGTALKKLNTADLSPGEVKATGGELVPAFGPCGGDITTFAYASVNGLTQYKTPSGKVEKVNVGVSSITNYPAPGIMMTLNTARGCGVMMEKLPTDGGDPVPGKVRELRIGLQTGPGFKGQKDFVLTDLAVYVTDDKTSAFVWVGPRFVEKYFTDGVYGCGSDGTWRLYGRVKPEFLDDIKNRPPAKKP